MTELSFQKEARAQMKKGVDILADAVKVTLGPKGRNVAIRRQPGKAPHITKDGVTVAKSIIELENPYEDMGAQMIKEVAAKTASQAGDGTTTATILAQAMITEGMIHLENGANPMDLKRGMDKAVSAVVANLKSMSQQVDGDKDKIINIATISANNDPEIGNLVADVMTSVGQYGIVTVADSKTVETYIKSSNGLELDKGFINGAFITNQSKRTVELEKPIILICDRKISVLKDIMPILEMVVDQKRSLLIISDDIDGEALATLVVNKIKHGKQFAAIKSPGIGSDKKELLEDIAIMVNATVVSDEKGHVLEKIPVSFLGSAERVVISESTTTIFGGVGKQDAIDSRTEALKQQIADCTNDYLKAQLERRLARITSGMAILYVGATTELELKEKKDHIDDALRATRSAIEEGILPGGGTAYLRSQDALTFVKGIGGDEDTGIWIVREALSAPMRQILVNAAKDADLILTKVKDGVGDLPSYGYNAKSEKYEDLLSSGVIDPTKVVRCALENAASIAAMFLTTECAITEIQK